jgi:hypothetical protein
MTPVRFPCGRSIELNADDKIIVIICEFHQNGTRANWVRLKRDNNNNTVT